MSAAHQGIKVNGPLHSCGRRHAWCGRCRPDVSRKFRSHAKAGAAISGWHHSEEAKKKIVTANRRRYEDPTVRTRVSESQARWRRKHPTRGELALRTLLTEAGLDFEAEHVFSGFIIDAWVPSRRLAFEADGHWAHQLKRASGYEEARDAYLIQEHGVLAVIHLTRDDLAPFLPPKGAQRGALKTALSRPK